MKIRFGKRGEVDKILEENQLENERLVRLVNQLKATAEYKALESESCGDTVHFMLESLLSLSAKESDPVKFAFCAIKILEQYRVIRDIAGSAT